ncbi:hypothetical protein Q31b_26920 [Novipirellula aureliae]|uniref:Uncharacterized protein n=2 Tax=Novipirellula aureliae TaxID=2527966 RepID=A0A5C6DV47_9BACT|nr:hypothetical protein Q31b_26920 [Novipirellula aureliae]
MQPVFTLELPIGAEAVIRTIRERIRSSDSLRFAKAAGHCAEFSVDPKEKRFWSPHLSVTLSDTEQGSQLYGRFSPRPEIWTFFMFIYFFMACLIFGGGVLGYCQWFMEQTPWALVLIPVSFIVIALLHLASLVGQSLSHDQMEALRRQLDQSIENVADNS